MHRRPDTGKAPSAPATSPRVAAKPAAADPASPTEDRSPPLATHLPPLDASMRGGIHQGSVVLVAGMPGTFKTSLCFWILYEQCLWEGRRALFITLEQTKASLFRQATSLGMDLEATAEHLRVLDMTRHPRDPGAKRLPDGWLERLKGRVQRARQLGVQVLAIDSLDALQSLADFRSRRDLFGLFEYLRALEVTSFLTTERYEFAYRGQRVRAFDAADFLSDGIVELSWREQEGGEFQRGLRVRKMRYRPHTTSLYHLEWDGGVRLTRALTSPRP